jgi:hypothetical protein
MSFISCQQHFIPSGQVPDEAGDNEMSDAAWNDTRVCVVAPDGFRTHRVTIELP